MTKEVVLKYLQKHGQKIDYEIVKDTGIDLKELRKTISELQSKNLIQTCTIIQHGAKGKLIEGIQCRIAGYTPPAAPGSRADRPGWAPPARGLPGRTSAPGTRPWRRAGAPP